MDNAQKAIMIGVGLFITIIIISAVMLITSAGQDMVDDSMGKLDNITSQLSASEWNSLDDKYMNGSQVIAYVKKYYNSTDILCYYQSTNNKVQCASKLCKTGTQPRAETAASIAIDAVSAEISTTPDLKSISHLSETTKADFYISPSAKYKSVLLKTTAGDSVGVFFVKK